MEDTNKRELKENELENVNGGSGNNWGNVFEVSYLDGTPLYCGYQNPVNECPVCGGVGKITKLGYSTNFFNMYRCRYNDLFGYRVYDTSGRFLY